MARKSIEFLGSFFNYVDKILPNFDPLPPRVDKHGHAILFAVVPLVSVNSITTRGADYAHHITASPPGFENPAASLSSMKKQVFLPSVLC